MHRKTVKETQLPRHQSKILKRSSPIGPKIKSRIPLPSQSRRLILFSPSSLSLGLLLETSMTAMRPAAPGPSRPELLPALSLSLHLPLAAPLLPPPLTPHRNRSTGEEGRRGEERQPRPRHRAPPRAGDMAACMPRCFAIDLLHIVHACQVRGCRDMRSRRAISPLPVPSSPPPETRWRWL